jgi:PilZ domain-containing protein
VNADALTEDAPSPGSGVSLLPMDAPGVVILGELASWYSSPGGLVVTARIAVPPETADALSGAQVWASAHTDRTDTLVVFSAVARSIRPRAGELELTGMTTLAREPRRRAVRASVTWPATVLVGNGMSAQTRDLSRGGCRLRLNDVTAAGTLRTGEQVELEVSLGGSEPIRVTGRTVRVDLNTGELTIRFLDLPTEIAARLDRIVFEELSPAAP